MKLLILFVVSVLILDQCEAFMLTRRPLNWTTANAGCRFNGKRGLWTPKPIEEAIVKGQCTDGCWVGIRRTQPGDSTWGTLEFIEPYLNWAVSHPKDPSSFENCAYILNDGTIKSDLCEKERLGVCEY